MIYQSDDERLALAIERARNRLPEGIGTQSERLVHAALKYYFAPDEASHEVRIRGKRPDGTNYSHVADIFQKERGHIYEIQTRGFERLRQKLEDFLRDYTVTVVYPIPHIRYISWVDPETGETSEKRKSPKTGRTSDILPEIYSLPDVMMHPNLEFLTVLIDLEEYDRKMKPLLEKKETLQPSGDHHPVFATVLPILETMEVSEVLPLRRYLFEGFEFFGPADADAFLTRRYGNYMELPPVEARKPHYSSVQFI